MACTHMAEGVGVAGLHDEGARKHWRVDANRFNIEQTSEPFAESSRKRALGYRLAHKEGETVIFGDEAAIVREGTDFGKRGPLVGWGVAEKIRRPLVRISEAKKANGRRAYGTLLLCLIPIGLRVETDGMMNVLEGRR